MDGNFVDGNLDTTSNGVIIWNIGNYKMALKIGEDKVFTSS